MYIYIYILNNWFLSPEHLSCHQKQKVRGFFLPKVAEYLGEDFPMLPFKSRGVHILFQQRNGP